MVQEIMACAMKLESEVGALAVAVEEQQAHFEEKTRELTAMVRSWLQVGSHLDAISSVQLVSAAASLCCGGLCRCQSCCWAVHNKYRMAQQSCSCDAKPLLCAEPRALLPCEQAAGRVRALEGEKRELVGALQAAAQDKSDLQQRLECVEAVATSPRCLTPCTWWQCPVERHIWSCVTTISQSVGQNARFRPPASASGHTAMCWVILFNPSVRLHGIAM
jgi:hypothetical protein